MTLLELQEILNHSGIPFVHHHWESPPKLPYGVYLTPEVNAFGADNERYYETLEIQAELYTCGKDPEAEEQVRSALRAAGIFWEQSEDYIDAVKLYRTMFEFEI